ncbi:phage holin family protein [Chrysosporum bergii ANA360D]|jgi:putative membrane protein|uniref:Phage holin family protein n=1 Tax=Chrysosporum bergii ANA360D TaxID=617107 RepID=A0AA43GU12_9CYAN|nr:phage holin family protein [Chrysosporum bergii]MDH6061540.1 phage holin family protein [Chrysosporum bergii ANA360D]
MWRTLFNTIATALSLLIVDLVVPGVNIANFPAALIAALVIGLINGSLKPVLSALSLPLNFLTFGGFSLLVNGFCFWLAAVLVPGFAVRGLVAFILGPVILSLSSTFINKYFAEKSATLSSSDVNTQGELPSR